LSAIFAAVDIPTRNSLPLSLPDCTRCYGYKTLRGGWLARQFFYGNPDCPAVTFAIRALPETATQCETIRLTLRYVATLVRRSRYGGVAVNTLRKATASAGVHHVFLGTLPYFVVALVAALEVSPYHSTGLLSLLSLGPALASVSRRAIPTAIIGAEALVAGVGFSLYYGYYTQQHGFIPCGTVAVFTVVGVVASAGRQRRERELADIRAVAEMTQTVLLGTAPSEVPGARLAVRYMSATAAARIGGDLYAVITTPGRVRLIVGDVQGKGIAAVRTASMVLGAFREAAYEAADLAEIAARIERSMRYQAAEQEFVTAVLAEMADDSTGIEILNCGHPPPLLSRGGLNGAGPKGDVAFAESPDPGLPLGLSSLADGPRVADTWPFGPGDQILFYTDGISEARDKSGAFYPLLSQCGPVLAGVGDPEAVLDLIGKQVVRHVGHTLTDDAAMLLVARTGAASPARVRGQQPVPSQPAPDAVASQTVSPA
jgi:serine phosphatase RsbU (regulator of sigma subunit)